VLGAVGSCPAAARSARTLMQQQALQRLAQILEQMPAVRDLHGLRSTTTGPIGVDLGPGSRLMTVTPG